MHPAFAQCGAGAADATHAGSHRARARALRPVRSAARRARRGSRRGRARIAAGRGRTLAGDRRRARAGPRPRRPRTEGAHERDARRRQARWNAAAGPLAATSRRFRRSCAPRRCATRPRCRRCTTCASKNVAGGISGADGLTRTCRTRAEVSASAGASPAGTTSGGARTRTRACAAACARDRARERAADQKRLEAEHRRESRYCSR